MQNDWNACKSQAAKWSSFAGSDLIRHGHYACGQTYAHAVQIGFEEGESLEAMDAPSPLQAMGVVAEAKTEGQPEVASFWQGYLSRWN